MWINNPDAMLIIAQQRQRERIEEAAQRRRAVRARHRRPR
jgi:hypothetical protein